MFFFIIISLLLFAVWIWTLVDIIQSQFNDTNEKLLWIVLVILLPFIGTILYFTIGSKNKLTS